MHEVVKVLQMALNFKLLKVQPGIMSHAISTIHVLLVYNAPDQIKEEFVDFPDIYMETTCLMHFGLRCLGPDYRRVCRHIGYQHGRQEKDACTNATPCSNGLICMGAPYYRVCRYPGYVNGQVGDAVQPGIMSHAISTIHVLLVYYAWDQIKEEFVDSPDIYMETTSLMQ
ncbi:hypothetical protein Bhyg_00879 [Pseudolycoriella hygida]|uniref:Uncharacterized protein n=1 Tax=Pseudolycoriella hygida TaxID=35572 RepID=A0A9Q0N971_9DIPT|nr:hypothetical protein Bhyg_00879 [Pseudolycoriella hygida]